MRKVCSIILIAVLAFTCVLFTGCGSESYPVLVLEFDEKASSGIGGTVKIELHPEWSPNSVNFIIWLVQNGYYDGMPVFRCLENTMVALGDAWNTKKIDRIIDGEFADNDCRDSGMSFGKGIVGMWYYGEGYDSCYGSIFACLNDSMKDTMDGRYAPVGIITEGMDILIAASCTGASEAMSYEPFLTIKVKKATVLLHGKTYPLPVTHTRTDYPGTESQ